jgi:aspartate/tyrosine/aromatic aminotransferase
MLSPFLEETELFERVSEERANMMSRLEEVDSIFYECSSMSKEGIEETFDSIMLTVGFVVMIDFGYATSKVAEIRIPSERN